jgi:hypothetical protein
MKVGLPDQALRSLVDGDTYKALTEQASEPLASTHGEIVRLTYHEPSDSRQPAVLNGVSFEDVIHY